MVTTLIIGFIVFGMSLLLYFLYFKKPDLPAEESARKNQDQLIDGVTVVPPDAFIMEEPPYPDEINLRHAPYINDEINLRYAPYAAPPGEEPTAPGTDYTRAPGEELPTPLPEEEELGPYTNHPTAPETLAEALPHWPLSVEDLTRSELRELRKIRGRELLLHRAAAQEVYTDINVGRLHRAGILFKQPGAPVGQVIAMGGSWAWPVSEFLLLGGTADGKNLVTRYSDPLNVDLIMEEFWGKTRLINGRWEVGDRWELPLFSYLIQDEGPSMKRLRELHGAGYYALVYDLKHDGTEYFFRGGKVIAKAIRMDMSDGTPTTDPD